MKSDNIRKGDIRQSPGGILYMALEDEKLSNSSDYLYGTLIIDCLYKFSHTWKLGSVVQLPKLSYVDDELVVRLGHDER